jgi:hypothetical protein
VDAEVDPVTPPSGVAAAAPPSPVHVVRGMDGERAIAAVLRAGAILAGLCFGASIVLERLSGVTGLARDAELLRATGASLLLVTPVVRLLVAGVALGLRGEHRYSVYAAVVLLLMVAAVGLGLRH